MSIRLHRVLCLACLLALILSIFQPAGAMSPLPPPENTVWFDKMGHSAPWPSGGYTFAVAVSADGQYVFSAQGSRLYTLDVHSNPGHVTRAWAGPTLNGMIRDMVVAGSYAYIAMDNAGLAVVDISSPQAPQIVGQFDTQDYATAVALYSHYAVVGTGGAVYVIDVSDPARPVALYRLEVPVGKYYYYVQVSGTSLYVTGPNTGLDIFDLSNLAASIPLPVHLNTPTGITSLTVANGAAYMTSPDKLMVVDVRNPAVPVLQPLTITIPGSFTQDTLVFGDHLYVLRYYAGVCALSLTNPFAPTGAADCPVPSLVPIPAPAYLDLAASGSYLYLGMPDRVEIHTLTPPNLPFTGGYISEPAYATTSAYYKGRIYLGEAYTWGVIDTLAPGMPLTTYMSSDLIPVKKMVVADLYVSGATNPYAFLLYKNDVLKRLQVSSLDSPVPAGEINLRTNPTLSDTSTVLDMKLAGGRLYILYANQPPANPSTLCIIDAINMTVLTQADIALYTTGMDAAEWTTPFPTRITTRMVYLARGSNGWITYDVTDANNWIGNLPVNTGTTVTDIEALPGPLLSLFFGPSAVATADDIGISIYDAAGSHPLLSQVVLNAGERVTKLELQGSQLIASHDQAGNLSVYNIADFAHPKKVGAATLPWINSSVVPGARNQILVTNPSTGLQVIYVQAEKVYMPMINR